MKKALVILAAFGLMAALCASVEAREAKRDVTTAATKKSHTTVNKDKAGAKDGGAKDYKKNAKSTSANKTTAAATNTQTKQYSKDAPQNAQQRIDQRQEWQEKRIQHGVKTGSLTADELAKLQTQEKNIADLENQFKGDGKLTREEFAKLRDALNSTSVMIWSEKRDVEGNQLPVYRLGKNVKLQDGWAQKLQSPDLTREEARAFMTDLRRTAELKRKLAGDDLTEEQRRKFQEEYNTLLNKYFVVTAAAQTGK